MKVKLKKGLKALWDFEGNQTIKGEGPVEVKPTIFINQRVQTGELIVLTPATKDEIAGVTGSGEKKVEVETGSVTEDKAKENPGLLSNLLNKGKS